MEVEVYLYGHLRYQSKRTQPFKIKLEVGLTGRELLKFLGINEKEVVLLSVNGKLQNLDEELELGDQVAIFPAINGG